MKSMVPLMLPPLVLGKVRALKYGRFVKPGAALRVEVTLGKKVEGEWDLRGEATVFEPGAIGVASPGFHQNGAHFDKAHA